MFPFRLMFWNMGSKATPSVVGALVAEHEPDVIVLVESEYEIVEKFSSLKGGMYA